MSRSRSIATTIYANPGRKPTQQRDQPVREPVQGALRLVPEGAKADRKPVTGQSAPYKAMDWDDFSDKERKIMLGLYGTGHGRPVTRTPAALADVFLPETGDETKANSWARNSLRRPAAAGWVLRAGPGHYRLSVQGRRCMAEILADATEAAPGAGQRTA